MRVHANRKETTWGIVCHWFHGPYVNICPSHDSMPQLGSLHPLVNILHTSQLLSMLNCLLLTSSTSHLLYTLVKMRRSDWRLTISSKPSKIYWKRGKNLYLLQTSSWEQIWNRTINTKVCGRRRSLSNNNRSACDNSLDYSIETAKVLDTSNAW